MQAIFEKFFNVFLERGKPLVFRGFSDGKLASANTDFRQKRTASAKTPEKRGVFSSLKKHENFF